MNRLIPGPTTRMRSYVVVVPARRSTPATPATALTRFVAVNNYFWYLGNELLICYLFFWSWKKLKF